jgi:PRC-barrel domain
LAILILLGVPAVADEATGGIGSASLVTAGAPAPPLSRKDAERLIGHAVQDAQRRQIGRIDDLLFDAHGGVKAAVVELDGFLGLGKRKIALGRDAFRISPDGGAAVVTITADELTRAPTYVERRGEPIVGTGRAASIP